MRSCRSLTHLFSPLPWGSSERPPRLLHASFIIEPGHPCDAAITEVATSLKVNLRALGALMAVSVLAQRPYYHCLKPA